MTSGLPATSAGSRTARVLFAAAALLASIPAGSAALQEAGEGDAGGGVSKLEETARDAARLAEELEAAARAARARATAARERAEAARRRSNEAAASLRRLRARLGLPPLQSRPAATPDELRARLAVEQDKHSAAARTPRENKARYLGRARGSRGAGGRRVEGSYTHSPGAAPDMADLVIRATGQWAINVARGSERFVGRPPGSIQKTGHVDYARLDIAPAPGSGSRMKWGIRRFNLGDVTVRDCDFTGIPKEHGIYDDGAGHALYRGNTFKDLGGQAIQLAHRDQPFGQYGASNMPFTGRATYVLEDNHAVDTGLDASRSGFVWTFFDPGTHRHPASVVLRGCTSVQEWAQPRLAGGGRVGADHPRAVRSPGGLVIQHYQHVRPDAPPATELLVVDDCLFDHTASEMPIAAIRGVGLVIIEDSCFLARSHRNPVVDIDDLPDMPSGRVVLQNNVSPAGMEVWLHVRGKRVCSLHCPGERIEVDVETLAVTRGEPRTDREVGLLSPLRERRAPSGIHEQPLGHVDDLGTVRPAHR